ncbi:MAG: hypothetical protein J0I33_12920 [Microbacterium ginsengisoli]|uniref:hypothetical protein n=1 Tax=Microbacterium TaxID=33882 RepID=UPI000A421C1A|nr:MULTISPECIES: hypothetical protein [unclassified Microbacterium]MBN9199529.1 hypothetical protein [Microbacterium ginsengisoli]
MTDTPPTRWCLSRRDGAVCTRAIGHAGLHNRNGTSLMWSDREQDEPGCRGSGATAQPAPRLDDGFPAGRALCQECLGFVRLTDAGTLWRHDAFRAARSDREAARRAAWFNAFGWEG